MIYRAALPLQEWTWQTLAIVAAALALGLATATDAITAVSLFGSAAAALALGVAFTYRRFGTLMAIWLFFLLQALLVAIIGRGSAIGHLVDIADIPILLVIGLLGLFLAARRHPTAVRWLLIAGGVVLACGFISDFAAGAQLNPSIVGATYRMKLFLALGAAMAVPWTPALAAKGRRVVLLAAVVVGLAGIFDFVSGGALRGIFRDTHGLRLGYVPGGSIFQNLDELNIFMAIAFTALLGMSWQTKTARRLPQLLVVVLAALSTLRLRAIVSLPAAALALALTSRRVRSRLVILIAFVALALGALITLTHRDPVSEVVNLQVGKYTSETQQPRQLLQRVGIEIAHKEFPLGAGFGRFGSAPSVESGTYSPVYAQHGLANDYGFRPTDPVKVALDAGWPGLLGEVGILGALAFGATLSVLTILLFMRSRALSMHTDFATIGFGVMVVILIQSFGGAALFQSFTLLTAMFFIVPGLWLASDPAE